ncbi:hypothetical protein H2O73_15535 [Vibrio sp. 404]|uniref:Oligosaccharide repeat unit polymerase n=1 Tax=Vibrio marinisediminis TaxID=2758441 RepID=A0A7W2IUN4_9VIBR|nr:hypothetical protein [Vibrio marinisediminis]
MQRGLFLLFCFMIPFENTALASIGGVFTAPLGITLIPLLALQVVLSYQRLSKVEIGAIKLLFGFFVYSFAVLALFYGDYNKVFLLDRGLRFILLFIPLIVVFLTVMRHDEKLVYQGVMVMASVIIMSFVLNLVARGFINSPSFLHQNYALSPHRMRGFTLEASTFGFQYVLVLLMVAAIYRIHLLLLAPLIVVSIILITSKGTLISFFITLLITFVVFSRINLFHKMLASIILIGFSTAFLYVFLGDSIINDVERYSSIATRGTAVMTAIMSLLHNPLGGGFFGYLPSMYEYGVVAMEFMDSLAPRLFNFAEFAGYLVVGETKSVSTKSFFFDWTIFGGVFFVYFYFKFVGRLFGFFIRNRMPYDFAILLFLSLATTFFMSIEVRYIAPFALGFLVLRYSIVVKKHAEERQQIQSKVKEFYAL